MENHDLFRHELVKYVEAGETWLSFGAPDGPELAWRRDDDVGAVLTAVARTAALTAFGRPAPATAAGVTAPAMLPTGRAASLPAVGDRIHGVGVSLYDGGHLGSGLAELGDDGVDGLGELAELAASRAAGAVDPDTRALLLAERRIDRLAVSVVVLHDREPHGTSAAVARFKLRPGLDAITVRSAAGTRTILPPAGPYNGWSADELVRRLQASAAGSAPDARWTTSRAASWIRGADGDPGRVERIELGFVARPATPPDDLEIRALIGAMAGHLVRRIGPSGLPWYDLDALRGRLPGSGTTPRIVHALATLADAGRVLEQPGLVDAARRGLRICLAHVGAGGVPGELHLAGITHGPLADCVLLRAAIEDPELANDPAVDALGRRLRELVQPDGRMARRPVRLGDDQDHAYLPAAALMAIAPWLAARGRTLPLDGFRPQLAWQRQQFRVLRTWSMVGWHPQGWEAVDRVAPSAEIAEYADEIAAWAIERQLDKNGAFLEDLSEKEPSFNTGFVAEGIAAAWAIATRASATDRAAACEGSWRRAAGFIRTLTLGPEDGFVSGAAADTVGGVRLTPSSARLRIDATSHCLHALVAGLRLRSSSAHPTPAPILSPTAGSSPTAAPGG